MVALDKVTEEATHLDVPKKALYLSLCKGLSVKNRVDGSILIRRDLYDLLFQKLPSNTLSQLFQESCLCDSGFRFIPC